MKKIFKAESIVPFSAFVVSMCAIVISLVEVKVMDEQKQASVWPRVFTARNTASDSFQVMVRNAGVGPAQIKYVEVLVDGKAQKSWSEVYKKITSNDKGRFRQGTLTNNVITPGETIFPLTINGEGANKFNADVERLKIKLCYCSIYERCWFLDETTERNAGLATPEPVEECKIENKRQFLR